MEMLVLSKRTKLMASPISLNTIDMELQGSSDQLSTIPLHFNAGKDRLVLKVAVYGNT